jgi:hypothetical protein
MEDSMEIRCVLDLKLFVGMDGHIIGAAENAEAGIAPNTESSLMVVAALDRPCNMQAWVEMVMRCKTWRQAAETMVERYGGMPLSDTHYTNAEIAAISCAFCYEMGEA